MPLSPNGISVVARQWVDDGSVPMDDWPDVLDGDGEKRLVQRGEWLFQFPSGGVLAVPNAVMQVVLQGPSRPGPDPEAWRGYGEN